MSTECRICHEGVPSAGDCPELVIVEACLCHMHKGCFLECLTEHVGDTEWPCRGCNTRPMKGFQIIRRGGTERVFQELPQGSERAREDAESAESVAQAVTETPPGQTSLQRDYRALPRAVRQENVYLSALCQHPHDPAGEPSTMECVIGDNSSEHASEFLRIVMLFVNQAVVQPRADIVQPSMRSIDEVITAALTNQTLIHEMLWSLATKTLEMPQLDEKANMTAEQESRVLAVFLMTELLLKVERAHRPEGEGIQSFFAQALEGQTISGDLWDALTRFKLAGSRHVVKRKRHHVLHDDFDYGHKFAMYGLHILQYDNVGFRPKAGYEQSVAIFWNDIPPSVLNRDGVYNKS
ncbi:hypothetical protein B484DRAFT_470086 [Ochromonadaceae sp. CCMP2298]|nr:hypothetical protein B484DRAFT_470086 [Ochromonadaceae sp. CCMP2298]